MRVDPNSILRPLLVGTVESVAKDLRTVGTSVQTSAEGMHAAFSNAGEFFQFGNVASGWSEGALLSQLFSGPVTSADEFAEAMSAAANALRALATELTHSAAGRPSLLARVEEINQRWVAAVQAEELTRRDPDAVAVGPSTEDVDEEVAQLKRDIGAFNEYILRAEKAATRAIRGIDTGTVVRGRFGAEVQVSQSTWGYAQTPYPGGRVTGVGTFTDRFQNALTDRLSSRIYDLGRGSAADAAAWASAHPDAIAAVGLIPPERAADLWAGLTAGSTARGPAAGWQTGPLATLLAGAPLLIGNLNGIPSTEKHRFNRAGLTHLLAREDLTAQQRAQLTDVRDKTVPKSDGEDAAVLLTMYLDEDGSPRASLAYGDVDTADQITALTHGIETDLAGLDEWSGSAAQLQDRLEFELKEAGSVVSTAVVVFMEWDSGSQGNVSFMDRPAAGAERLTGLLGGFQARNPSAQVNMVAHSLGTTMTMHAVATTPGLVDNVYLLGSAGVDATGIDATNASSITSQIASGELRVSATHATEDFVAPMGRGDSPIQWFVDRFTGGPTQHTIDPRELDDGGDPIVTEFGSDGGFVAGYGDGDGEYGERVGGHNAHNSDELIYANIRVDGFTPMGDPIWVLDRKSIGYLDESSESFKRIVMALTADAERVTTP